MGTLEGRCAGVLAVGLLTAGCVAPVDPEHDAHESTPEPPPGSGTLGVIDFGGYAPEQTVAVGHAIQIDPRQPTRYSGNLLTITEAECLGPRCTVEVVPNPANRSFDGVRVTGHESGTATLRVRGSTYGGDELEDELPVTFAESSAIVVRRERHADVGAAHGVFPGARMAWWLGVTGAREGGEVRLMVPQDRFAIEADGAVVVRSSSSWQLESEPTDQERLVQLVAGGVGTGQVVMTHGELTREIDVPVVDPAGVVRVDLFDSGLAGQMDPAESWADRVDVGVDPIPEGSSVTEVTLGGAGDARVLLIVAELADGTRVFGGYGVLTVGPMGVVQAAPLEVEQCPAGDRLGCAYLVVTANGPGQGTIEGTLGQATIRVPVEVGNDVGGSQ